MRWLKRPSHLMIIRGVFSGENQYRQMMTFRSCKHEIFTEEVNKIALSADDDKRIILLDKVNTLAYGHYSLG